MFCTLRQKTYSFKCALALWRGLNGAAHCCGNDTNQRRGKRREGCYCCFRVLHKQERLDWSRDFTQNMAGFHLSLPCLCKRQRQASGRFWENRYRRTNQPPQEGRRASKTPLSQREDLSLRWRPCGVPPPSSNCYQTDQLWLDQTLW